jgi:hypothetical protein
MHQAFVATLWFWSDQLEFRDHKSADPETLDNPEKERMRNESNPDRGKGDPAPNGVTQISNVPCQQHEEKCIKQIAKKLYKSRNKHTSFGGPEC